MMKVYIDGKELKSEYGIAVLDHTPILGIPPERSDSRTWADKSGIDKNLSNIRYDTRDFTLECLCKATNEKEAFNLVQTLCTYMFQKGCFVVSLRGPEGRFARLCERTGDVAPTVNIRKSDSLYAFKLSLRETSPNSLVYYKSTNVDNEITIAYDKGRTADVYLGNGTRSLVSNSNNYTFDYGGYYGAEGSLFELVVDVDRDMPVISGMTADFTYSSATGITPATIQFTDTSTGSPILWSWDFGDGTASAEKSPSHVYTAEGVYTVKLQIFNAAQGTASITKTAIITVARARLLKDSTGGFVLISDTDYLLIN